MGLSCLVYEICTVGQWVKEEYITLEWDHDNTYRLICQFLVALFLVVTVLLYISLIFIYLSTVMYGWPRDGQQRTDGPALATVTIWPSRRAANFITMVDSTKVVCPQNLFSRKSQRYKGRMFHCVDIRHLCFWHRHLLWLLLTKITIFCKAVNKSTSVELLAIIRYIR